MEITYIIPMWPGFESNASSCLRGNGRDRENSQNQPDFDAIGKACYHVNAYQNVLW